MRGTRFFTMICVVAVLGLGACDSANDPVRSETSADPMNEQMASVAVETDQLMDEMLTDGTSRLPEPAVSEAVATATTTITEEIVFSRSRSCPAGGEIEVDGRLVRTYETDTRTMEWTFTGTRTLTDCAFVRDEHKITVDGSAQLDVFRRRVDGLLDGLQTSSASGSWEAVRDDGETRSCSFSIEVVRDPDNLTRTVSGFLCETEFAWTISWDAR